MTKVTKPRSLWRRICSLIKPDWIFGFMLIASIAVTIFPPSNLTVGGDAILVWPFKPMIILVLLLIIGLIATFGVALDKKFADDYHFQLMANGAIVAIMGALFVILIFDLFDRWLPQLATKEMLSILLLGWSSGYFFYRIKGLNQ